MSYNNEILYLPVSLGEAIDKLTILDIKLDKIVDNRRIDVKKEYDLLYEKLTDFIIKYENLYKTMKKVNLLIWDMMDILRDGNVDEEKYLRICKECVEYNDIRFRVKNKINYVSNSLLKEQKSYKTNRLVVIINKNINDNTTFSTFLLNIIKHFSFIYDEINITSEFNLDYLQTHFEYDSTILFKSTVETEILDYKCRIIIEEKEYSENEVYNLFNITEFELNKII
jgi:hypothetical protein